MGGTIESGSVRLSGIDTEQLFRQNVPLEGGLAKSTETVDPLMKPRRLSRAERLAPVAPGLERHYLSADGIERARHDYEG